MLEYLKDRYIRSWGNGPTWRISIDPPRNRIRSYYEEIASTAEYIYANKTGHVYLLYSGGMDSEFVFNVFLKLGFDFTPVIVRLGQYNHHDLKYAFDFCESKCVTPKIIDIDFDEFVQSGHINQIAESVQCGAHQLPATLLAAKQLDGFVVMGDAPPHMKLVDHTWYIDELECIHSILKYFELHSIAGCPFILNYTPESLLSFLLDPTMVKLANNEIPGKTGNNSSKIHVFNNNPDFEMLPRTKYTGYEHIEDSEIFQHPNILKFVNEYKHQWYGEYVESYHSLVKRLSCMQ